MKPMQSSFRVNPLTLLWVAVNLSTCAIIPRALHTGEELSSVIVPLGPQISDTTFGNLSRDGGSGGNIGGNNIILYSDTENLKCGTIINTFSYSNVWNPRIMKDFGSNGCPRQGIPYTAEEAAYTNSGQGRTRIVIWPQSAIIPLPNDNTRGFAISPVSVQSAPDYTSSPSRDLYTTLYTITIGPNGPTAVRTVPKLMASPAIKYGAFGTVLGKDNYLYFIAGEGTWGVPNSGLKLARATWSTYLDWTRWQYWTGTAWVNTIPQANTAKPFIPGFFSSGDLFWSNFLNTYVCIYFTTFVDSTFRYRYALPDAKGSIGLTGNWSKEYVLMDTTSLKKPNGGYNFNYAGHAYPGYDPTGKTVVLSMTLNDGVTPYFLRAGWN